MLSMTFEVSHFVVDFIFADEHWKKVEGNH